MMIAMKVVGYLVAKKMMNNMKVVGAGQEWDIRYNLKIRT